MAANNRLCVVITLRAYGENYCLLNTFKNSPSGLINIVPLFVRALYYIILYHIIVFICEVNYKIGQLLTLSSVLCLTLIVTFISLQDTYTKYCKFIYRKIYYQYTLIHVLYYINNETGNKKGQGALIILARQ